MAFLKNKNFAKSTLAGNITNIATSVTVAAGEGALFPSTGDFRCVIWGAAYASPLADTTREIVTVTARTTDTLTIVRAAESTTNKAWSTSDNIALVITAGKINELEIGAFGANIASATTIDFSVATGNIVHVTGTTTTTGVTMTSGQTIMAIADAAWPLTYHVTNLKLEGEASYTCTAGDRLTFHYDGTTVYVFIKKVDGRSVVATSKIVQVVNTQTGAVATGTTDIPFDDTIPQNTEGDQYMSLAITPTSATNKLKIDVVFSYGYSGDGLNITVALFQDTTANALAAMANGPTNQNHMEYIAFSHYMTAGTTSATTFKVRAGDNGSSTLTFNGRASARYFGGVIASSITITEILV